MKYATFNLSDLFTVERGTRLTVGKRINGDRPLVTAGFENTGVAGYISNPEQKIFPANVLTIDMFGNVFYRNYEFSADDNILVLTFRDTLNRGRALFLTATISASVRGKFSYGKQYRQGSFNTTSIELPVDENGKIDFPYMENRIRELEAERIRELEAYLKVTGLSDHTLTPAEQAVLAEFRAQSISDTPPDRLATFRVGDIFDVIRRGKRIRSRDRTPGDLPFVTAGIGEMGISSYISAKQTETFPAHSLTIDMFGSVLYRGYEFGADDHVAVLHNSKNRFNRYTLQYIQPHIAKVISGKYDYSRNFYASDAPDIRIKLPVTQDGHLDTNFMELFIRAQQKLAIKNVVQWRENYITTARRVTATV